ncbi:MAG: HIT domain-containing protein [Pseudomonadales bacterium]|jgi:diadenosine tetraphosphate (Ap4A) HIT family hydrolase|nr:HIT domain-containing protein [Pseudomonadales bacterium]MCP5336465.1 HIT domain-containing protein [Pseudomonadales bacterium]
MTQQETGFALHPALAADCALVGDLPLCRVLLMRDRNYPWLILVPRRSALRELHELSEPDLAQFWSESARLGRALMVHFGGDKLNVAALGNQVPQLHVHHIVRFTGDPAWPRPVWGVVPVTPYSAVECDALCATLRDLLGAA